MAKAKPLAESVQAELDAIAPTKSTWFARLDDGTRDKLLEARRLRREGHPYSVETVLAYAHKLGVKVGKTTLLGWLNATDE